MKAYLIRFRDEAFAGAWQVFKRLIAQNILLNLILFMFGILVFFPMYFNSLGMSVNSMDTYRQTMQDLQASLMAGAEPEEVLPNMFGNLNPGMLLLTILTAMLFYAWVINVFFTLSDSEIRHGNRNVFRSIALSFNTNVVRILFYFFLNTVLVIAVFVLYSMVTGMLMGFSKVLGILFAFTGYFAVLIFLLRFMLGIPAIVHGNMSAVQAWAYSYKHLNWKRASVLMLIIMAAMVVMFLIMLALMPLMAAGNGATINLVLIQLIFFLISACTLCFGVSAMSALYFRYSDDEAEPEHESEHLIND